MVDSGPGGRVESDFRYYQRRAAFESAAALRAVTPAARERRLTLARSYAAKAVQCGNSERFAFGA
jgi:hypothetical protein